MNSDRSREMVLKFFNRSPITLKFEAEKIRGRESRKRERERERERASCYFYACKLSFYTRKLVFYPCNLLFYL